jgi:hypothetical protein
MWPLELSMLVLLNLAEWKKGVIMRCAQTAAQGRSPLAVVAAGTMASKSITAELCHRNCSFLCPTAAPLSLKLSPNCIRANVLMYCKPS